MLMGSLLIRISFTNVPDIYVAPTVVLITTVVT